MCYVTAAVMQGDKGTNFQNTHFDGVRNLAKDTQTFRLKDLLIIG